MWFWERSKIPSTILAKGDIKIGFDSFIEVNGVLNAIDAHIGSIALDWCSTQTTLSREYYCRRLGCGIHKTLGIGIETAHWWMVKKKKNELCFWIYYLWYELVLLIF